VSEHPFCGRLLLIVLSIAVTIVGCQRRSSESSFTASPIAASRLAKFLPEIAYYQVRSEHASDTSTAGVKWSFAQRIYARGSSTLTISIFDYAHQEALDSYARFLDGFQSHSDEGYTVSDSTAGLPGWVTWEADDKEGAAGVNVAHRFYVVAYCSQISTLDGVRRFVAQMNLAGLAQLS
jgi:hypothetical protein